MRTLVITAVSVFDALNLFGLGRAAQAAPRAAEGRATGAVAQDVTPTPPFTGAGSFGSTTSAASGDGVPWLWLGLLAGVLLLALLLLYWFLDGGGNRSLCWMRDHVRAASRWRGLLAPPLTHRPARCPP